MVAEDQAHHEDPGQVRHQAGHIRTHRHGACDQKEESSWEIGSVCSTTKYLSGSTTHQHALVKGAAVLYMFFLTQMKCSVHTQLTTLKTLSKYILQITDIKRLIKVISEKTELFVLF